MLILGCVALTGGGEAVQAAEPAEARTVLIEALTNRVVAVQIQLVGRLATSDDPMVERALAAWRQGGVFLHETPDHRAIPFLLEGAADAAGQTLALAIETAKPLMNAAGAELRFAASGLTPVDTTSKLRKAIKSVLDQLALANANPAVRRDAAGKLGQEQNRDYLPALVAALTRERDPTVRRALQTAVATIQLAGGSGDERVVAARELAELRSVASIDLLRKVGEQAGTEQPELARATKQAVASIEAYISRGNVLGTAFRGVSLGAVLLIAAIGLAITFGLMGIINMAHGEMITIGAYVAFVAQNFFAHWFGQGTRSFDLYFVAALPVAFLAAGLAGLILERGIIRFLYRRPLESLLATYGVSLLLQQGFRSQFGPANVQVYSPGWLSGSVSWYDQTFAFNRMFVIAFAVAIVVGTWLALTRTTLGLQVRAVMQNRRMAACLGIRTDRVNMATFAFGSGLAGLAGACLSQIGNIGPSLGQSYIVDSFMVVVLGGVGSLVGTVSAAGGIGLADQILQPFLGAVLGKISVLAAIILFLQWRPAGLFAARGRGLEN